MERKKTLQEVAIRSMEKRGLAAWFLESAVALRQEKRENVFEYHERIILEELDKEVREAAIVNLKLMIEKKMRDREKRSERQREESGGEEQTKQTELEMEETCGGDEVGHICRPHSYAQWLSPQEWPCKLFISEQWRFGEL